MNWDLLIASIQKGHSLTTLDRLSFITNNIMSCGHAKANSKIDFLDKLTLIRLGIIITRVPVGANKGFVEGANSLEEILEPD